MSENNRFDVIIVGAGASGLAAGVFLSSGGKRTLLVEKLPRCGKKLSASGNGQGNLSNKNLSADFYHGDRAFIQSVLSGFTAAHLKDFFSGMGGELTEDGRGRYYLSGFQASSATDLLRFKFECGGGVLLTETRVTGIVKKSVFEVQTERGVFFSGKVIIACGGMAAKHMGTEGDGYAFAKGFGHGLTPLKPSLVQLTTNTDGIKGLKGIKADCILNAYQGDILIKSAEGEILFTDYGVSGNAVFSLSSYVTDKKDVDLSVEFMPGISASRIKTLIGNKLKAMPSLPAEYLLAGLLGGRLSIAVLKRAGVNTGGRIDGLSQAALDKIIYSIKNFTLKVTGNLGFDSAQVTKGGIPTEEIDCRTMMSKKTDGLYFTGEVMDVDGDCGGYNLHWAFATAKTAADSLLSQS